MVDYFTKVVDFKRPQEFSVVYGSRQANGSGGMVIRHEFVTHEGSPQYAIKIRIPTIGTRVGGVALYFKYINTNQTPPWMDWISIVRVALVDGNNQDIVNYPPQEYSGEGTWQTVTFLPGIYDNVTAIEMHLAIGYDDDPPALPGMEILFGNASYVVYAPAEADNPGEEECSLGATAGQGSR